MARVQIAAQITKSTECWIAGIVFIESGAADIRLESASDERAARSWVEKTVESLGHQKADIVYIEKPDA